MRTVTITGLCRVDAATSRSAIVSAAASWQKHFGIAMFREYYHHVHDGRVLLCGYRHQMPTRLQVCGEACLTSYE